MSAVATQPRLALRRVAVRVAVAPLTLIVALSAVVRTLVAWQRASPAYFPDEYMYSEFGRSIAAGHLPQVRGQSAHFMPLLQPLLTAPAWLVPGAEHSFRAVQAIDATLMSLAAIPVYLLARRVGLRPRLALVAAALSLTFPALLFSSFVLSEPVAYPVVLAAIAAAVHALDRPSARSYGLFLGLTVLAMFARIQFAVLLPCFFVALVIVSSRERRLRELVRRHRWHLGALVVASGVLLALGPARQTGYYPSFTFVPGFHLSTAARYFAADAIVLLFACGFVLVPGALVGMALTLWRPASRSNLALAALTAVLTPALLAQGVVYGNIQYVQERYLFYLLPLWTIAFLLYAQRGWQERRGHALVAAGIVTAALVVPLTGYAAAGGEAHSPFLFAFVRMSQLMGGLTTGAFVLVIVAAFATALVVGLSFYRPSWATAAAIAIAIAATGAASVGAVSYDQRNAHAIRHVMLGDRPTWVDATGVGHASVLVPPGSRVTDALFFWNRSLDRMLLLPGVTAPDSFAADHVSVAIDGTVLASGKPVTGPLVIADRSVSVTLQNATVVARSPEHVLLRPHGRVRLGLVAIGRFSDGWLASLGKILIWPRTPRSGLAGRLVLAVTPPTTTGVVTLHARAGGGELLTFRAHPGRQSRFSVPVCSSGPIVIDFAASPVGGLGDGRSVAAHAAVPRFVPDPRACAKPGA